MGGMKALLLSLCLVLAACTSETEHGDCVGLVEERNPALKYEADLGNIFLGIIFSETIVVPIVVGVSEVYCPVERK